MATSSSPTEVKRLTVRSPDELTAMTFDDSHVIIGPHVLTRGQNACVVGPGGVGKTRLCYQMAICSVIGWKFLGFPMPNNGLRWLFMQVENDNRRLMADFSKYKALLTPEQWAKVNKQIFIHTLESDHDGFLSLDVAENRKLCVECIGDLKVNIVIWDSLMDFGFGDLNHDVAMFSSLSELGRITKTGDPLRNPIPIHHALTGREAAGRAIGWERAGYGRGSKALHQWARTQINVAPGSETGDVIIIGAGKCSDSKEFAPFAARLNPDSMFYERDSDFNIRKWQNEVARKNAPLITPVEVGELCGIEGISKRELLDAISMYADCTEKTAYRAIEKAQEQGKIRWIEASEKYVRSNAGAK